MKKESCCNSNCSNKEAPQVWCKYRVEFGCCDGRMGAYLGDTIEQVHQAIDRDTQLSDLEKSCLKFGYFWEFQDRPYTTQDYVIDNGIHFMWVARKEND